MRGLVSVILLLAATAPSALAALLAVDYGAEWTKASLVKPGTPFDVLLDKGTSHKPENLERAD
jgi:hypoxia up-regulated 1